MGSEHIGETVVVMTEDIKLESVAKSTASTTGQVRESSADIKKAQRKATRLFYLIGALVAFIAVILAGQTALVYALFEASKETKPSEDGMLMVKGTDAPVKVAEATVGHSLDSRLPDNVWAEIKYIQFTNNRNGMLHLLVLATTRFEDPDALYGTYIHIFTHVGKIILDGSIVTFEDSAQGTFKASGFSVTRTGRRLQGHFQLIGLFNSIPAFTEWDSFYDRLPYIPATYKANGTTMRSCEAKDTYLCNNFGIGEEYRVELLGEQFASYSSLYWADEASGRTRMQSFDVPYLPGWTSNKWTKKDTTTGDTHAGISQAWGATGEHFFCRTDKEASLTFELESAKWLASFKGEVALTTTRKVTQNVLKFRLKNIEDESAMVDYYVVRAAADANDNVITVHPKLLVVFLAGMNDTKVAYEFDSFIPLDSVPASDIDPPGGVDVLSPSFNTTLCASTMAFTADGSIPLLAEMSSPPGWGFAEYETQPDSAYFVTDLQREPKTTAAEWVARQQELDANLTLKTEMRNIRRDWAMNYGRAASSKSGSKVFMTEELDGLAPGNEPEDEPENNTTVVEFDTLDVESRDPQQWLDELLSNGTNLTGWNITFSNNIEVVDEIGEPTGRRLYEMDDENLIPPSRGAFNSHLLQATRAQYESAKERLQQAYPDVNIWLEDAQDEDAMVMPDGGAQTADVYAEYMGDDDEEDGDGLTERLDQLRRHADDERAAEAEQSRSQARENRDHGANPFDNFGTSSFNAAALRQKLIMAAEVQHGYEEVKSEFPALIEELRSQLQPQHPHDHNMTRGRKLAVCETDTEVCPRGSSGDCYTYKQKYRCSQKCTDTHEFSVKDLISEAAGDGNGHGEKMENGLKKKPGVDTKKLGKFQKSLGFLAKLAPMLPDLKISVPTLCKASVGYSVETCIPVGFDASSAFATCLPPKGYGVSDIVTAGIEGVISWDCKPGFRECLFSVNIQGHLTIAMPPFSWPVLAEFKITFNYSPKGISCSVAQGSHVTEHKFDLSLEGFVGFLIGLHAKIQVSLLTYSDDTSCRAKRLSDQLVYGESHTFLLHGQVSLSVFGVQIPIVGGYIIPWGAAPVGISAPARPVCRAGERVPGTNYFYKNCCGHLSANSDGLDITRVTGGQSFTQRFKGDVSIDWWRGLSPYYTRVNAGECVAALEYPTTHTNDYLRIWWSRGRFSNWEEECEEAARVARSRLHPNIQCADGANLVNRPCRSTGCLCQHLHNTGNHVNHAIDHGGSVKSWRDGRDFVIEIWKKSRNCWWELHNCGWWCWRWVVKCRDQWDRTHIRINKRDCVNRLDNDQTYGSSGTRLWFNHHRGWHHDMWICNEMIRRAFRGKGNFRCVESWGHWYVERTDYGSTRTRF